MKRSSLLLGTSGFVVLALGAALMFLVRCSPDAIIGDFDVGLTSGYRLERESPDKIDVYHETNGWENGVPAKVVEIVWNDRFILAKQQELQPRGDLPGDTYPVPVPEKFHYWIIDVAGTNRHGPMSEAEFKTKVRTLGQEHLKLQDVHGLRNLASQAKK